MIIFLIQNSDSDKFGTVDIAVAVTAPAPVVVTVVFASAGTVALNLHVILSLLVFESVSCWQFLASRFLLPNSLSRCIFPYIFCPSQRILTKREIGDLTW